MYKQLRAKGEPSPLLRIAEAWLRAEVVAKRAENVKEQADGPAAIQVRRNYHCYQKHIIELCQACDFVSYA